MQNINSRNNFIKKRFNDNPLIKNWLGKQSDNSPGFNGWASSSMGINLQPPLYKILTVEPQTILTIANTFKPKITIQGLIDPTKIGTYSIVNTDTNTIIPLTTDNIIYQDGNTIINFDDVLTSLINGPFTIQTLINDKFIYDIPSTPTISTQDIKPTLLSETPTYITNTTDISDNITTTYSSTLSESVYVKQFDLVEVDQSYNLVNNGTVISLSQPNSITNTLSVNKSAGNITKNKFYKLRVKYNLEINNSTFTYDLYGTKIYSRSLNLTSLRKSEYYTNDYTNTVDIEINTDDNNLDLNSINITNSFIRKTQSLETINATLASIISPNVLLLKIPKSSIIIDSNYTINIKTFNGLTRTITPTAYIGDILLQFENQLFYKTFTDTTNAYSILPLELPTYIRFRAFNPQTQISTTIPTNIIKYELYDYNISTTPSDTSIVSTGAVTTPDLTKPHQIYASLYLNKISIYYLKLFTDAGKEYTLNLGAQQINTTYNLLGWSPTGYNYLVATPITQIRLRVSRYALLSNFNTTITFRVYDANVYDFVNFSNALAAKIADFTGTITSISNGWLNVTTNYTPTGSRSWITLFDFKTTSNNFITNYANLGIMYTFGNYAYPLTGGDGLITVGGYTPRNVAIGLKNAVVSGHMSSIIQPFGTTKTLKSNNYLGFDFPSIATHTNVVPSLNEILQRNRTRENLPHVIIWAFKLNNFNVHQTEVTNNLFPTNIIANSRNVYKNAFTNTDLLPLNSYNTLTSPGYVKCNIFFTLRVDSKKYITSQFYSTNTLSGGEFLRNITNYNANELSNNKYLWSLLDINSYHFYNVSGILNTSLAFTIDDHPKYGIGDSNYYEQFNGFSNKDYYFKYTPSTNIPGTNVTITSTSCEFYFAFYPNGNIYMLRYSPTSTETNITNKFGWTLLPTMWNPTSTTDQFYPALDFAPMTYNTNNSISVSGMTIKDALSYFQPSSIDPTTIVTPDAGTNMEKLIVKAKFNPNQGWVYRELFIKGWIGQEYLQTLPSENSFMYGSESSSSRGFIYLDDLICESNLIRQMIRVKPISSTLSTIDLTTNPNFSIGQEIYDSGVMYGAWSRKKFKEADLQTYTVSQEKFDGLNEFADGIRTGTYIRTVMTDGQSGLGSAYGDLTATGIIAMLNTYWNVNTRETEFLANDVFMLDYTFKGGNYLILYYKGLQLNVTNPVQNEPFIGINYRTGAVCFGNFNSTFSWPDPRQYAYLYNLVRNIDFYQPIKGNLLKWTSGNKMFVRSHISSYSSGFGGEIRIRAYEYKTENMQHWIPLIVPEFWEYTCKDMFDPLLPQLSVTVARFIEPNGITRPTKFVANSVAWLDYGTVRAGTGNPYLLNTQGYTYLHITEANLGFDIYPYFYTRPFEPNLSIEYTPISAGMYAVYFTSSSLVSKITYYNTASNTLYDTLYGTGTVSGNTSNYWMATRATSAQASITVNGVTTTDYTIFLNPLWTPGNDFSLGIQVTNVYGSSTNTNPGNSFIGFSPSQSMRNATYSHLSDFFPSVTSASNPPIGLSGIYICNNGTPYLTYSNSTKTTATTTAYSVAIPIDNTSPPSPYSFATGAKIAFIKKGTNLYISKYDNTGPRLLTKPLQGSFTSTEYTNLISVWNTFINGTFTTLVAVTANINQGTTTAGSYAIQPYDNPVTV